MKFVMYALALVAGASMYTAEANAQVFAWGCKLDADIVSDKSAHVILIKVDSIRAYGKVNCVSATGKRSSRNVYVRIKGFGVGPGLAFPKENGELKIYAVKAGISKPEAMFGKYSLAVGPGVTLLAKRVGLDGGGELTPGEGIAATIRVTIRDLVGLGVDFSGYTMRITPTRN